MFKDVKRKESPENLIAKKDQGFLLLHTDGSSWSSARTDPKFWEKAGEFVQQQTNFFHCRSGIKLTCSIFSSIIIIYISTDKIHVVDHSHV